MSTFTQLIDSTLLYLAGFTTQQDQSTHITGQINSSVTTMTVADPTAISKGIVEIDSELLWVDSVNSTTGVTTIAPYGRGFRGTTAASHAANARVVTAPLFPRTLVQRAINESIQAVYPDLFAVASTVLTYSPAVTTYELPSGAKQVLAASWQTVGPTKEWIPLRRWRVDQNAATTAFTSGASLSVYDTVVPGKPIKVVYTKQPTVLANDNDEFATVTGLPSSCEDVIRLGAAYRLVPFLDTPHLQGASAEADFSSNMRPVGGSSQLGRYFLQMYQVRLSEEVDRLQNLYPVRSHYTR